MTLLTCRDAEPRLHAFHDGELTLDEQIAVEAHLDLCYSCRWEAQRLTAITRAVRAAGRPPMAAEAEFAGVRARVLGRVAAERQQSIPAQIGRLFEDWHLVWAGLGATVAAVLCVALTFVTLHFASLERDDSLAAVLSLLASPGSNENPLRLNERFTLPRVVSPNLAMPAMLDDDAEDRLVALTAVLTREGRLRDLAILEPDRDEPASKGFLEVLARARFEPAQFAGTPVAVNMVWLVAHTTVRAKLLS